MENKSTKQKPQLIRPIVPLKQWLTDPFYVGAEADYIRPYVSDFLHEYFDQTTVREAICTGAARTGKSYGIRLLVDRISYEVSCWNNFPCLFGLSPSTLPKIFWLSYTLGKSESTGIKQLIKIIDNTPYWQLPGLKRKDLETEIRWPFLEILNGSNASHVIGEDMLGCVLDEANVRKVAKGTEVAETQKLFQEIAQRSVMTYSDQKGTWGGFTAIISSSTTASSFVAKAVDKAKKDHSAIIMEAAVYEANPNNFSKDKFDVFLGDGNIEPFIVDKIDASITAQINNLYGVTAQQYLDSNPQFIEHVPVSIRRFYEDDLIFALANMSGKVMASNSKLITNKNSIKNIWNDQPFTQSIPEVGIYDTFSVFSLWNPDTALADYHGENVYLHIDASQKHDHTGFSALYYNVDKQKICSILTIELFINKQVPDNQIDQEKILQLILYMRDSGVNFALITGDHYARDFLIPQCKKIFGNDKSDYYSVDVSPAAYLTMLNFINLQRYSIPYYGQLQYELENLLYDRAANKVDHPHNSDSNNPIYFKDCSDAFAGATEQIYLREHIHYEQMMIDKETEKLELKSDHFYDDISLDDPDEVQDEIAEFQQSLYGLDFEVIDR